MKWKKELLTWKIPEPNQSKIRWIQLEGIESYEESNLLKMDSSSHLGAQRLYEWRQFSRITGPLKQHLNTLDSATHEPKECLNLSPKECKMKTRQ